MDTDNIENESQRLIKIRKISLPSANLPFHPYKAVVQNNAVVQEAVAQDNAVVQEAVAQDNAAIVQEAVAQDNAVVQEAVVQDKAVVQERAVVQVVIHPSVTPIITSNEEGSGFPTGFKIF